MTKTPITKLRRQIMRRQGLAPVKKTKRLVPVSHIPDSFPKTTKMKEMEYKYDIKMESMLWAGSLNEVVQLLNGDVDRSTISRWREYVIKWQEKQEGQR